MTVFYGERGQPVATIENDRLFKASGEPHGFLKDGYIFAIQDNFATDEFGQKISPGQCFGYLVNGVMYDNKGYAFAFCLDCRIGDPEPLLTGRETVPEDLTQGRDIRGLLSVRPPEFFLAKLSPIASFSVGEITRRELGDLLGEPISFGETLMKLHEHKLPLHEHNLPLPRYGKPFNAKGIEALRVALRQARGG
jgi:hypothetical protein